MIPVLWLDGCRGNWDHGVLMEIFDKHPNVFHQWNGKEWINLKKYKNAIVIISGNNTNASLRDYLLDLDAGSIVILTSEEDAYFNWQYAIPDHLDLWTQYYSPLSKQGIKTRLLLGPPSRIKDYKINSHLPKKYLWSFVGQVQNPFRQECVQVLKQLPKGFIQEVEFFGGEGKNGMEYQQYLDIMCQSEYVICPAGSMCVDSFRLYEAMECGAIPITDRRAPRDPEGFNYWHSVYIKNRIITLTSWTQLPVILRDVRYPDYYKSNDWWSGYKADLEQKLLTYAADKN